MILLIATIVFKTITTQNNYVDGSYVPGGDLCTTETEQWPMLFQQQQYYSFLRFAMREMPFIYVFYKVAVCTIYTIYTSAIKN